MRKGIFGLVLLLTLFIASSAWAHEHREVAGKYMFMVGFVQEPAFAKEMNGVDLHVTDGDKPVEGLENTLHVTVLKLGQKKSIVLPLHPKYKEPGRYAGYFLPTKAGAYVFIFEGTINGVAIKEQFESTKSGQGKFHDVEDPVLFP